MRRMQASTLGALNKALDDAGYTGARRQKVLGEYGGTCSSARAQVTTRWRRAPDASPAGAGGGPPRAG